MLMPSRPGRGIGPVRRWWFRQPMPYKFTEGRRHKLSTAKYRVTNWGTAASLGVGVVQNDPILGDNRRAEIAGP